jgi:hypothetical protein
MIAIPPAFGLVRMCPVTSQELKKSLDKVAAVARAHHQLGFGSGGYAGTAGTKPFRFGISTFGSVLASMTSVSLMMPFR